MLQQPTSPRQNKPRRVGLFSAPVRRAVLENLSMLLTAGVDPASAMRSTSETLNRGSARRRLQRAQLSVDAGRPVWQSLEQEGLLTPQETWLVRIGEESGALAAHMDTVVEQERREETFRSRLLSAMLYPVTVLVIALIVGGAVSWLILPRLAGVFASLNVPLPFLTRILIALGEFLKVSATWAVPLAVVLLVSVFLLLFIVRGTRRVGQWLLLETPGIGRLIREIELSRFGYVVGSLLSVGVPLDQTLEALAGSGSLDRYQDLYRWLHRRVSAGQSFGEALSGFRGSALLIPPTVRQMVTTAEQSARLPEAAQQIGAAYERRLDVTAKNLIATIEPLLLFVVWLGVLLLAIAIITPIYSILQGIQR